MSTKIFLFILYLISFILVLLFMNCLCKLFFLLHAFNKPVVSHVFLYLIFLHVLVIFVHALYKYKKCSKS